MKRTKQKGITLIALVITIIVLLILAAVSIATLTGENGLLTRTNDAKTETEIAEEKEGIKLAISEARIFNTEKLIEKYLQDAMNSIFGKDVVKVIDNKNSTFTITFIESNRSYEIDENSENIYSLKEETDIYVSLYDGTLTFSTKETINPNAINYSNIKGKIFTNDGQVNSIESTATTPWFYDRNNITKVKIEDEIVPTNMANWFYRCSNITSIDLSNINTCNVTDMSYMFCFPQEDKNTKLIEIKGLDTFNTSKVQSMSNMFSGCSALTNIDISNFNTSSVKEMNAMFKGCTNLMHLDLDNFNTSNVTTIAWMFQGCENLTKLNLKSFNTSNVKSMNGVFLGCTGLNKLDLTNFDTKNVTTMNQMFYNCSMLTEIIVSSKWNVENVISNSNMFTNCGVSNVTQV